jgi:hypothetical protein
MRFLEMTTPVVHPEFDSANGRKTPALGDYIYPTFMQRRGTHNIKDLLSRDDLVALAVLANQLEGKAGKPETAVTRFRKAPRKVTGKGAPVYVRGLQAFDTEGNSLTLTVTPAEAPDEWTPGKRMVRNA